MTKAISQRPTSPCIQVCRIAPASQQCKGCGRTLDEIARWSRMPDTEKASVWERIETTYRVTDA